MAEPDLEPDWQAVVREFTSRIRDLYGARLSDVILYGSRARGDARSDSDIDLLVVLDPSGEPCQELERMNPIACDLTLEYGVLVSAIPVGREEFQSKDTPFLLNVRREGRRVA